MERPQKRSGAVMAAAFLFLACQGGPGEAAPPAPETAVTTTKPEAVTTTVFAETTQPIEETITTLEPTTTTAETTTTTLTPTTTTTPTPETTTTTVPTPATTTTAAEVEPSPERTLTKEEVAEAQTHISRLLPVDELVVDGLEGPETQRRMCILRQMQGDIGLKPMSLEALSFGELELLRALPEITTRPETNITQFYINTTCKMGVLAQNGIWTLVTEIAMGGPESEQFLEGGEFEVEWERPEAVLNQGWWTSTLYPDLDEGALGNMYRPLYFAPNIAVHGSLNTKVGAYSHGCIRTPVEMQDYLVAAYHEALVGGQPMYISINNGL